jgi:predicted MFS family arabinose efflux permease
MRPNPSKTGYFVLEGLNSFATSFFFNYLLFLLRDAHGFGNLHNLITGAAHGLVYTVGSWYGGRFGQRYGYFTSLRVGFAGLVVSVGIGALVPALWGQLLSLGCWTLAVCFTWPMLEALVSERESAERLPNRVGLYNVVWALTAAMGYSMGGWIFQRFGKAGLYGVPMVIHAAQFLALWPLKARHDAWIALAPQGSNAGVVHAETVRPRYFQRLAWAANPLNYMAANTILAVVPGIASHVGLTIPQAGLVMSVWYYVRTAVFAKLWWWPGWHYHFGWFLAALVLLVAGFAVILTSPWVWLLVVAQIAFGWASAVLYYSSLYYAMDGSDSHGADGGVHEALIGMGICGGPAVSALGQWITGNPMAPAWTVTAFLAGGIGLAFRIRAHGLREDRLRQTVVDRG